jgi:hypothetical protein
MTESTKQEIEKAKKTKIEFNPGHAAWLEKEKILKKNESTISPEDLIKRIQNAKEGQKNLEETVIDVLKNEFSTKVSKLFLIEFDIEEAKREKEEDQIKKVENVWNTVRVQIPLIAETANNIFNLSENHTDKTKRLMDQINKQKEKADETLREKGSKYQEDISQLLNSLEKR